MARKPVYLFQLDSNSYLYLDTDETGLQHRAFVGKPGKMKELEVSSLSRRRDGGTTYVSFSDGGDLFVPSPLKSGEPTYNGEVVTKLAVQHNESLIASLAVDKKPSAKKPGGPKR